MKKIVAVLIAASLVGCGIHREKVRGKVIDKIVASAGKYGGVDNYTILSTKYGIEKVYGVGTYYSCEIGDSVTVDIFVDDQSRKQ